MRENVLTFAALVLIAVCVGFILLVVKSAKQRIAQEKRGGSG